MDHEIRWQPSASIEFLRRRSNIIANIRHFFISRGLFEVDTPTLSEFPVSDMHIASFATELITPFNQLSKHKKLYLISSPEFHMKRLLAAGSGPIFQLCHAFRNEELGKYHNPEFTLLEWYRPDFNMQQLIDEVDAFLQFVLNCSPATGMSYQAAFQKHVGLDPLSALQSELADKAKLAGLSQSENEDKDTLLQFLFTTIVEKNIGLNEPTVIYHFPASQAALAKLNPDDPRTAQRFEFYYRGLELANGFHELADPKEQYQRFLQDNCLRHQRGLAQQNLDTRFIAALEFGLPDCSGVALGVDRLIMLALQNDHIAQTMAFSNDIA